MLLVAAENESSVIGKDDSRCSEVGSSSLDSTQPMETRTDERQKREGG